MTIQARYAGICRLCNGPIAVGESIEWVRGQRPAHADQTVCKLARIAAEAAPVAAPPEVEAPSVEAGAAILAFMRAAQGRGLSRPRLRFLAPASCGEGATMTITLATRGAWQGWAFVDVSVSRRVGAKIDPTGRVHLRPGTAQDVADTLEAIGSDPATAARAFGAMTSSCSFCGLGLTDAGSVEVGYGPVCAERYGLPHTPRGSQQARRVEYAVVE